MEPLPPSLIAIVADDSREGALRIAFSVTPGGERFLLAFTSEQLAADYLGSPVHVAVAPVGVFFELMSAMDIDRMVVDPGTPNAREVRRSKPS